MVVLFDGYQWMTFYFPVVFQLKRSRSLCQWMCSAASIMRAKQVDEDDEELMFIHTHQVLFDDIIRLRIATKLIEIMFTIDGWTEEYAGLSNDVNNPLNEVLDVFRKMEYYMVAQKKDMKHQKTD